MEAVAAPVTAAIGDAGVSHSRDAVQLSGAGLGGLLKVVAVVVVAVGSLEKRAAASVRSPLLVWIMASSRTLWHYPSFSAFVLAVLSHFSFYHCFLNTHSLSVSSLLYSAQFPLSIDVLHLLPFIRFHDGNFGFRCWSHVNFFFSGFSFSKRCYLCFLMHGFYSAFALFFFKTDFLYVFLYICCTRGNNKQWQSFKCDALFNWFDTCSCVLYLYKKNYLISFFLVSYHTKHFI